LAQSFNVDGAGNSVPTKVGTYQQRIPSGGASCLLLVRRTAAMRRYTPP
jgi:hypothetical protein